MQNPVSQHSRCNILAHTKRLAALRGKATSEEQLTQVKSSSDVKRCSKLSSERGWPAATAAASCSGVKRVGMA